MSTEAGARRSRWRWLPVLVMSLVTVAVLVLYFTPVMPVRSVRVEGATTLSNDEVVAAADIPSGTPMLQVDPREVRSHLEKLPKVADAEVSLAWPSTMVVQVTERTAVAFVRQPNGFELVDASGVSFASVPKQPDGMPELRVSPPAVLSKDDAVTQAAMTVLRSLTPELHSQVLVIEARTWSGIHLRLTGNREVQWGEPADSPRKAAILPALLTRPGTTYDISSPYLPTVS